MDSMDSMMYEITTKVQETEEEFIFRTIYPFLSNSEYTQEIRISKTELINALRLYQMAKQLLGVKK